MVYVIAIYSISLT